MGGLKQEPRPHARAGAHRKRAVRALPSVSTATPSDGQVVQLALPSRVAVSHQAARAARNRELMAVLDMLSKQAP